LRELRELFKGSLGSPGDLAFKVHNSDWRHSFARVKVLWDICSTILTPVGIHLPQIFLYVTIILRRLQSFDSERLSASWRIPSGAEKSGS
jgi:hypothetical protein